MTLLKLGVTYMYVLYIICYTPRHFKYLMIKKKKKKGIVDAYVLIWNVIQAVLFCFLCFYSYQSSTCYMEI